MAEAKSARCPTLEDYLVPWPSACPHGISCQKYHGITLPPYRGGSGFLTTDNPYDCGHRRPEWDMTSPLSRQQELQREAPTVSVLFLGRQLLNVIFCMILAEALKALHMWVCVGGGTRSRILKRQLHPWRRLHIMCQSLKERQLRCTLIYSDHLFMYTCPYWPAKFLQSSEESNIP